MTTTNLDDVIAKYDAELKATRSSSTAAHVRRLRMERAMIIGIVDGIIAGGNRISVYDSEEWTVKSSTDRQAILSALATTDEDTIRVRDANGVSRGTIVFTYGNDGHDLVGNYSDNEWMNNFYESIIEPLADKLQSGAAC